MMVAEKTLIILSASRYAPSDRRSSANRKELPVTTPDRPGWYDDPQDPNAQRYWNGQDWTPHRQRKPISRATPPLPPPPSHQLPPPSAQPLPPPSAQPLSPPPQAGYPPPPPDPYQSGAGYPPPPSAGPQRSRAPIAIAALIAVIAAVLAGGFFAYKYVFAGNSDEDQIKALVQNVTAHQNNADGPGLLTLLCSYAKAHNPATSPMLRNEINQYGTVATSVADIHVTGDRATAVVTTTMSKSPNDHNPDTWSFTKEGGSWKYCPSSDNSG
jgi:hypothetical protein